MSESAEARDAVLRALCTASGEATLVDVAHRVARALACAEPQGERERWGARFAERMCGLELLPSLPALTNAGRGGPLAACYVLEPDDSLRSIYDTLSRAARIQQGMGGSGIDLSRLRPRGSPIARSGGVSPGPVAFLDLFACSAEVNRRAGRRLGAHLAILDDGHADVLAFVRAKRGRPGALAGLGIAVALHDSSLDPGGGSTPLLGAIAESIHATGEPSVLFVDAIERANPHPERGPLHATNPCGEQPLLPDESCVLAALCLPSFADASGHIDAERLGEAVRDGVRLLDDMVETASFPDAQIRQASRATRKIGLGIMGLADVLLLRGIAYDDPATIDAAEGIMSLVAHTAREASEALAEERGPYPAWGGAGRARRNATLLAVAPTGTLRLLAGCNGGIEPLLDPVLRIRQAGKDLRWVDRTIRAWAAVNAPDPAALIEALGRVEDAGALPGLSPEQGRLLRPAWQIDAEAQIRVQARVQSHVDGAVSKTVHLAESASPEEILRLLHLAWSLGCKGVSFFRRGSAGLTPMGEPTLIDLDRARLDEPLPR